MVKHCQTLDELLDILPKNQTIVTNEIKAWSKVNNPNYSNIYCGISGGGDSDVMLDILYRCDKDDKITYVWFNTGIEYQATKDHLNYLEQKYNIEILRIRPNIPVPLSCKRYGIPFISKNVSSMLDRLQKAQFDFKEDGNKDYEFLINKYKGIDSFFKWWCNMYGTSTFNIKRNKWLKEFLIENPPTFKISSKCCSYAKKKPIHKFLKEEKFDLNCSGIRRAEGGIRATAYKNCFDNNIGKADNYRPLFFYTDKDKIEYEEHMGILHSKCYTEYGLKRTGCVGCPYEKNFEFELEVIQKYESKLYKAILNIFGESYEYTRKNKEFCKKIDEKYNSYANYLRINNK